MDLPDPIVPTTPLAPPTAISTQSSVSDIVNSVSLSQPQNREISTRTAGSFKKSLWGGVERIKRLASGYPGENAVNRSDSLTSEASDVISEEDTTHVTVACRCCGTAIKYPSGVVKVKCAICHTTLLMAENTPVETRTGIGRPLSISLVERIIAKCYSDSENASINPPATPASGEIHPSNPSGPFAPLEQILYSTAISLPQLNQSFIRPGRSQLRHSTPGFDMAAVESFYRALLALPTAKPLIAFMLGLKDLLKELPVRAMTDPRNLRWVLVALENPILLPAAFGSALADSALVASFQDFGSSERRELQGLAYSIVRRSTGLLAHSTETQTQYLLNWFARYTDEVFVAKVQLLNAYLSFRLLRHHRDTPTSGKKSVETGESPASINTNSESVNAYSQPSKTSVHRRPFGKPKPVPETQIDPHTYALDWQMRTAACVLAILFAANLVRGPAKQKCPVSEFYNTMVDFVNVRSDFEKWAVNLPTSATGAGPKLRRSASALLSGAVGTAGSSAAGATNPTMPPLLLCQFPFLLSLGAKTVILEHEARKQMARKAEEAFVDAMDRKTVVDVHLKLRVRRGCLAEDSLAQMTLQESNLKKSLKVEFVGEPGIDAGGLRKEWFALLSKELLDPSYGMFIYDDESHKCWFARQPLEQPSRYYLVGVVLGLAIYNSTILGWAFPSVLYKKLLGYEYGLEEFAELFPAQGRSLKAVLAYEGDDFTEVFGLNFAIETCEFGAVRVEELIPGGSNIPVTRENRSQYVAAHVRHYLDTSVSRQFEPFKRGFYHVMGGNALSLFTPEEIELLVCGAETDLDIPLLQTVTRYNGFGSRENAEATPVVQWFWKLFTRMDSHMQRKLLVFVTGSDRVPATGISNMRFKLSYLGGDSERLPSSHTCFNELCLYGYKSEEKLEAKLRQAMEFSQGFGLK